MSGTNYYVSAVQFLGSEDIVEGGMPAVVSLLEKSGIDPAVLAINQHVCLKTVGQIEDDLATVMIERLFDKSITGENRTKWELGENRSTVIRLEIVALPIGSKA